MFFEGGKIRVTPNMNAIQTPPGEVYWPRLVDVHTPWVLLYQSPQGLVCDGHIVATGQHFYRPDAILLNDVMHFVWALDEGESQIASTVYPLATIYTLPSVGTTIPNPPPPEPPKPMDGITQYQFEALQALRAKYPDTLTPEQGGALINAFAWMFSGELGMQRKDSGTGAIQPRTGLHIWNGIRIVRNGQHLGQDVFGGASVGLYTPTRGEVGAADPATFVQPVDPETQPTPPPPPPTPDLSGILKSIEDLRAHLSELQDHVIKDLVPRIAALEQTPAPVVTLPKLRVKGSTSKDYYHAHRIDLEVVPE